jgi:hypothetical protein
MLQTEQMEQLQNWTVRRFTRELEFRTGP